MSIGLSPEEVDKNTVSDEDFAAAMGIDGVESNTSNAVVSKSDYEQKLPSRETMWTVIQQQAEQIDALEERVGELEVDAEKASTAREDLAANAHEAKENAKNAREVSKAATAKVNQLESEIEDDDNSSNTTGLPGGVDPATSPLDLYTNCSPYQVKRRLVDEKNKKNSWRAVTAARRWDEFATRRKNGSGIFWTRVDLKEAITAIDGEKPHGTTITRVWNALVELGGSDITVKERCVSQKQEKVKIVAMDIDTAEGLNEMRYHEFDLLEDGTVTGGVTPVVTGRDGSGV
ncbi:hypothetical protein ZOD2009_09870 [Haladaptatus paucihalophilus DX253]|uniref:Uncharacterized protein n=1 Tax=Haladaptatus paucihalophilus DX253 TaxID=797209 RepID=E7QSW6_HALPU|nr:hypothetical protein [Haladaptatus paucihalophilus]EFW92355.1 hypothetical protein ZOD2009_09870 [Haladaptatus paucihalophilus DX253]SHL61400.1 hypothetical protein SAMN05444342_4257 [Haladaptatus paucihalophilus DX253]